MGGCKLPAMDAGLVLSGLFLVVVSMQVLLVPIAASLRPPAIYVFGDSTLDVGNNNYLPGKDVARANRSYYGVDFPGIPTGRFSNGYNTADYVAKSMGFVSSPPPYLSLLAPTTTSSSLLVLTALTTGVSYASGDAGILDSTNPGKTISLWRQVDYFKATKAKMSSTLGSRAVDALLSRSIFLIGVGSNDMFVFAAAPQQDGDVAAFYVSLVSNYSAAIQELHSLGARKFAVINVGMVGCVPRVRVLDGTGACADAMNQLAAGFDAALGSMLAGLAPRLPGMAYSLADSFLLTQDAFARPEASGYANVAGACCGGGRLGAEADCQPGATLCANRGHYLFWDRVHPSQRAAMLSAKAFYDGPAQFTSPISFKQLAHKI